MNLDTFPTRVSEWMWGVDKPVRDRMKGLVNGVKNFIDADTLRNFSHLFSVKVGKGTLVVCTLNLVFDGCQGRSSQTSQPHWWMHWANSGRRSAQSPRGAAQIP